MPVYIERINGDVDRPTDRPTNQPTNRANIEQSAFSNVRKKAEICNYLVVSVLQRIAGRYNLWDEINNLYLFLLKSLVWWEFLVGLMSNCTHLCLAVCGVERVYGNRHGAIAPGFI